MHKYLVALFLTSLASASSAMTDAEKNKPGIAIQICSLQAPKMHVQLNAIMDGGPSKRMGGKVAGTSLNASASNALEERWEGKSADGNPVASMFEHVDGYWTIDAVTVDGLVWPVAAETIPGDKWTSWMVPNAKAIGTYYSINRAQGVPVESKPITPADAALYRVRFKRMPFIEYLNNMPKADGPMDAWTLDPIPECN